MGKAMELLTGYVTGAAGTDMDALTMLSGNSLTLRNAKEGSKIWLISAWALNQANDTWLRIRSPRLHDNVEGMTFAIEAGNVKPLFPMGAKQELVSQDTLVVEMMDAGAASDLDYACLLVYYEDLPGIDGRFITLAEFEERSKNFIAVRNTLTLDTDGTYDAEEAINAEYDLLKANTDYALVGNHARDKVPVTRYRGTDTGNLGIGIPGGVGEQWITGGWFLNLARLTGLACIPVMNSANKSNFLIDSVATENDVTQEVSTIFCELR